MKLPSQAISILGILIACAMSGLVSGSMVTQDFRSDFLNFGWGSQVGPGIVFGFLFSITSIVTYLRNKDHKTFGAIAFIFLFTIASMTIYFIAFQIAMWMMIILEKSNSNGYVAGGLAGLFGAGVLAVTAKFLSETRINFRDEILTTALGTVAGILFFSLLPGGSLTEVNWTLPFLIWQVAVGWSLSRSIQKGIGSKQLYQEYASEA
jgi:hypothetical protein